MSDLIPVTLARGDGIGPEIMDATLQILDAAKAPLKYEEITIGKAIFDKGISTGIEEESWESLKRTKIFLKAPIFTPSGGGFKSLNVTVRKTLGLYANVRPCASFAPYIPCNFPDMDMVIIRENEEDLYAGVEYQLTNDVMCSLKLITRQGSERIIRYAFEYARANGRKKVTCMIKDNIMKMADGLFHKVFEEIATEYPDIENERFIIDIGAARIASRPESFDVIVTQNLYGDIVSDIAADVAGSVGIGISANIGENFAMFEAMHGTAPDIAGKGIANPSGLLLGAVMMLTHLGQGRVAGNVHNAWLKTIEDGFHTGDLYKEGFSKKRVGTADFAKAVIDNLGAKPAKLKVVSYGDSKGGIHIKMAADKPAPHRNVTGADILVLWNGSAKDLAEKVQAALKVVAGAELLLLTNRGIIFWPGEIPASAPSNQWCCRLKTTAVNDDAGLNAAMAMAAAGLPIIGTFNLALYDETRGWTLAQGE